ncbi:hypothetical protein AAFF_G00198910 [Aldrovandia affinis]|uniref:TNF family profile domain-containing protein n=1 Tax=Aldrovandia affinis TaxID=143900 RepID=A0AAD7RIG6_9TELE|nr:hypothetical protein AAFF_G00198910 [Aldrovandia affinis]
MTATDTESLQPRAARSWHACLVTSVIALFVLLLGVTVTATLIIRQIQTELATVTHVTHEPTEDTSSHEAQVGRKYKMKKFAYLHAETRQLGNITMEWASSELVGSGYNFNHAQQVLKTLAEGSYLLYLDLVFRCDRPPCGPGSVTVQVVYNEHPQLECRAQLPRGGREVRAEKCWGVRQLSSGDRLLANMDTSAATAKSWSLDTTKSGMGMIMIDGESQ